MAEFDLHQRYELKPSRIALGFQLFCLAVILIVLFSQLNIWLCMVLAVVALFALNVFKSQKQVQYLQYLDQGHWSLQYLNNGLIERVSIKQMFDHSFYVVIHFDQKNVRNLIIWQDQLSEKQWKSIKSRVKLH